MPTVLSLIDLARASPLVATVAAALLIIVGGLVIVYPWLLAWIAGIGLVLAGIAVLAAVFIPSDRISP
jgi:hypothetical protein